jgi:hypothetical protein
MRRGIMDVQTNREKRIHNKILHSPKGLGSPDPNTMEHACQEKASERNQDGNVSYD